MIFCDEIDIMLVCETWSALSQFPRSMEWSEYVPYCIEAIKEKSLGRASGGLLALVRKRVKNVELIVSCEWWLFLHVCIGGSPAIIGLVYRKPSLECTAFFYLLSSDILDLQMKYSNCGFILGGDFNCRVGNENQLESAILENTSLFDVRNSQDNIVNEQGKRLIAAMEDSGLVLINGRTSGDWPGKITYVSKAGKSVIDLVWCNIVAADWVSDFHVMECNGLSDHFPVVRSMNRNDSVPKTSSSVPARCIKLCAKLLSNV